MNPSDEEIEALLARLSPAAPDPALMARLRAARPKRSRGKNIVYLALPFAAAAALAFALVPQEPAVASPAPELTHETGPAPEPAPLEPVGSLQHLMEVADLGVIQGEDEMPLRLIRTRWIDEIIYRPSDGGEPVAEGRVREEILPVSMPVY
ncbi:hypothetical protein OJ996_17180 [Luteolibacter sp. GHJ8]|jgi:hypothetical protein|uniref:Uncharacterized protein n=1 Tax=Luteolibacter rhizosphaerae TaxID=2989719 RepID=A0ABT3G670_9BACT|nr:hypothetical protein [Luteolibacter rhizosphaerae]MCW1915322.1 hypothetical protein [Luteolibacter rhizosphaerae]